MASLVRRGTSDQPVRRDDLEPLGYRSPWGQPAWSDMGPALDMYESDEAVVVEVSLPGVDIEDVSVKVTGDTLSIEGEMKEEKESTGRRYMHRERTYGRFFRSITLPSSAEASKADAVFSQGVLTVTVPKTEQAKPSKVQIKAK